MESHIVRKLGNRTIQDDEQHAELSADEALQLMREHEDFKEKEYDLRESNNILRSIEAAKE